MFFQDTSARNIHKAMEGDPSDKDYLANVAMAAHDVVKNEIITELRKNYSDSEFFREEGNKAYKEGLYQKALVSYNKALAFASNMSLPLKFAYSNRSAVLFSAKKYEECIKDCDTALGIKCTAPSGLTEKLERRKAQAQHLQSCRIRLPGNKVLFQKYADEYFELKSQNDSIPCASADIDVVIESGTPKVVAKRDIPIGTIVAFEKAFVSWAPTESDQYISCYYCRKLDLNLFPCGGCVIALFCSKECEENCLKEYHTTECEVLGYTLNLLPAKVWILRALMKLRNMCSSWDELISISYDCGNNKKDDIYEMYNSDNPSSMLSFNEDRHFMHGAMFNNSIICGLLLVVIQRLKIFLPQDAPSKRSCLMAIARIMMYWSVYCKTTILGLVTSVACKEEITDHARIHVGFFAFIGKLRRSCMPNILNLAFGNSMALVALEEIKAGTELTIPHVFHWLEDNSTRNQKKMNMFLTQYKFCTCIICSNDIEQLSILGRDVEVSAAQKNAVYDCIHKYTVHHSRMFNMPPKRCMMQIFKTLACLNNVKLSEMYKLIYKLLIQFYMCLLDSKVHNRVLSQEY